MADGFPAYAPKREITFFAGTMQLKVESDAAYLVLPGAKSRFAGFFYLESNPNPKNYNKAPHNAPILVKCKTLQNVVWSAAEVECGGLYNNAKSAVVVRRILEGLGHKQNPTKMKTDNSTAKLFVHLTMRAKQSKTWDMRYN